MAQARRRFGSLRHLPSDRWQVRYKDTVGRIHTAPLTFATKRDAERFLVRTEADMERGTGRIPASVGSRSPRGSRSISPAPRTSEQRPWRATMPCSSAWPEPPRWMIGPWST
jgi:hypothetical protein